MNILSILTLTMTLAFTAAALPPTSPAAEDGPAATTPKPQKNKPSKRKKTPVKKAAEVYACPMGDYSGPLTKDGRCPKCGMQLQEKWADRRP